MKEKEEYFNYIWVSAEIGKVQREIKEKERLLAILEKNKIMYEIKICKKNEEKEKRKKRK